MNQKKAKELRRKAHNQWVDLPKEYQEKFTVHQLYKQLKKDLKRSKNNDKQRCK